MLAVAEASVTRGAGSCTNWLVLADVHARYASTCHQMAKLRIGRPESLSQATPWHVAKTVSGGKAHHANPRHWVPENIAIHHAAMGLSTVRL